MDDSIGIYIHIPFCKAKCNYCDFNSYSGREHLAGSYFNSLYTEMERRARSLKDRTVRTIFIGGGTPSLVDPQYIVRLLELCRRLFSIDPHAEISMESNPGTLSFDSLKAYRNAGVNRLSIGLQAWQDRLLKEMGRIHDHSQFAENLTAAWKAGFRNINADLIFGLPGQSFEDWKETLTNVTALGTETAFRAGKAAAVQVVGARDGAGLDVMVPDAVLLNDTTAGTVPYLTHLSCYSLKIEEGTVFGERYEKGLLEPCDDELDRRMYHYAIDYLAQQGYRQYEISNFARPGFECRHNLVYWNAREYAGFGAGAHSYLNGNRFSNQTGIERYIRMTDSLREDNLGQSELFEGLELIDRSGTMSEYMILGLRLTDGISEEEFEERFGESLEKVYGDKLEKLVKRGLLISAQEKLFINQYGEQPADGMADRTSAPFPASGTNLRYKLTSLGLDLANQVFVEFI